MDPQVFADTNERPYRNARVARAGAEQERLERFVQLKIRDGRKVFGTNPPDDKTRAEYEDWVKAGEPGCSAPLPLLRAFSGGSHLNSATSMPADFLRDQGTDSG